MFNKTIALTVAVLLVGPAAAAAEDGESAGVDAGPSLHLSGFADFNYRHRLDGPDNSWFILENENHYYVGNLNLYLDGQLSSRARSLVEVRFTYLPNGVAQASGALTRTSTADYAIQGRNISWGGIDIERAWVEYRLDNLVTVRAGQFLTPWGVWNVDHGSPTLLSIQEPYTIASDLFPRQQVGLEAYGSRYFGNTRVGYHATMSNGRIGNNPQYLNLNGRFGFGGRVFVENDAFGDLRIGANAYRGKYSESESSTDPATYQTITNITADYHETALGGDLTWKYRGLSFQGELVYHDVQQTGKAHPAPSFTTLPPHDYYALGGYAIVGYELPWLPVPVTPFVLVDITKNDSADGTRYVNVTPGVNVRVQPNLVLKVAYEVIWTENTSAWMSTIARDTKRDVVAQVAWAF